MYISSLKINNFRCFKEIKVDFNEGINVIIGANNAGKTTLTKALELIFNRSNSKMISIDDFHKKVDLSIPPEISIEATLKSSSKDTTEDKAIVASWLTKLETPWEATLTYKHFLPEQEHKAYVEKYESLSEEKERWALLESTLKKYVTRIYGGDIVNKMRAEGEHLDKIHCETLDALRDVERKMFTGRNTLLKQLLLHFKDSLSNNDQKDLTATDDKQNQKTFTQQANLLVEGIIGRVNQKEILEFAKKTGASVGGSPALDGYLQESDVLSTLRLIIKDKTGIEIPIINNGMGYNNLIFISLILSKFKMITSDEYGENAKAFPILIIEEPEAHLHPALQYNFLKFLKEEVEAQSFSRQIFVTTHSTQITSAVGLKPIICLEKDDKGEIFAKYPSKVFSSSEEDQKSKKYVERFLDATKSAMLFSKSVLLVEGMAELILLPLLAEREGTDLEKHHVSLVRADALTFKHFIKLFGAGIKQENTKFALKKRVACLVDPDPTKIEKKRDDDKQKHRRWKKCWPYELNSDLDSYEYKDISGALQNLLAQKKHSSNVDVFYKKSKGKTFEYDLAWDNYKSDWLFDESIEIVKDNELIEMISCEEEKEKAKMATSFLLYANDQKGELAFILASKLEEKSNEINVPLHIKQAFRWVSEKDNSGGEGDE
ncbi:AAA family ATPase [Lysinibacillus sp. FSL K6-0232]|uniref:ATP-dependent nuclease n=1 Tax=Lysinibacillus sp. FSL K6-0232 TaxID=2921425 RepID=UPI0030FAD6B6